MIPSPFYLKLYKEGCPNGCWAKPDADGGWRSLAAEDCPKHGGGRLNNPEMRLLDKKLHTARLLLPVVALVSLVVGWLLAQLF